MLRGRAVAADRVAIGGATLRVDGARALAAGADVELAIRPERVRLAAGPGDNVLDARVEGLVYQGAQTEVTARLADGQRVLAFVHRARPRARWRSARRSASTCPPTRSWCSA